MMRVMREQSARRRFHRELGGDRDSQG
jgi:hypothetical protein